MTTEEKDIVEEITTGSNLKTKADFQRDKGKVLDPNDFKRIYNPKWKDQYRRFDCYYWQNIHTDHRVGWVFRRTGEAIRWRDNRCWRYAKYSSLEEYLASQLIRSTKRHTELWKKHRDEYHSLILRRGVFMSEPQWLWWYEVDEDGNLISREHTKR